MGLKLAGIEVVSSYEWWKEANHTHNMNFGKDLAEVDIRKLELSELPSPSDIDIVVGSPPCTQFSFSNRGGKGDIQDGLIDVYKFLLIVDHIKPRYWAMENVPRVSKILERELNEGGQLYRFRDLVKVNEVVDISEFGVPQRRRRMIAGNFPKELLFSYKSQIPKLTLGDVLDVLQSEKVVDPIYGYELRLDELTDHIKETPLSPEEERMNRESKSFHPVYNKMQFPDAKDRPSRTITALCTRVSRESIVIDDAGDLRRLTVRERGLCQSFPITFQYYGDSYGAKIKMIGNAIPPLMTFFIAQCMQETSLEELRMPREVDYKHATPTVLPKLVKVETQGRKFSRTRKFRAALPSLRFGSGMRFELENYFSDGEVNWRFNFFFGTSTNIKTVPLRQELCDQALSFFNPKDREETLNALGGLRNVLVSIDPKMLQEVWTRRRKGIHPFEVVDKIGAVYDDIFPLLNKYSEVEIQRFVLAVLGYDPIVVFKRMKSNGSGKILNYAYNIFLGLLICSWGNTIIELTFIETAV